MEAGSTSPASISDRDASRLRTAEWIVFGLLFAWLALAAWWVRVELFDGFQSLCNARFFLGYTDKYQILRFPMMGLLMTPAEAIKEGFGLHPLELRPHHVTTALLHAGFLVAAYRALTVALGRNVYALLGLVCVALNAMFFNMAPFINVDIMVGAVLLWMLIYLDRFLEAPNGYSWLAMVVLGFFAASIKHVFGVFWIGVFISGVVVLMRERPEPARATRTLAWLALGAIASGLATWVLESAALHANFPDEPFWSRPWMVVGGLLNLAAAGEDLEVTSPTWLYLRNSWAYGVLLVGGTLLGIPFACRARARRIETIAVVALVLFLALMQFTPVKNVRFLSAAVPTAALLAAAAFQAASSRRQWVLPAIVLALVLDLILVAPAASRVISPFYAESALVGFLEPMDRRPADSRVYWIGEYLNFLPPEGSRLSGDQYDEIYHFGAQHLRCLYDLNADDAAPSKPGDLLITSTHRLHNPPTWNPSPPENREHANQSLSVYRAEPLPPAASGEDPSLQHRGFSQVTSYRFDGQQFRLERTEP